MIMLTLKLTNHILGYSMGDNVVRILQGVTEFDGTNQENVIDNIHEILDGNMNGSQRFTLAFWMRHMSQKNSQILF